MTGINPVALTLFGIQIRWYGILISLGMILALLIGLKRLKKYNIPQDEGLNFFLCMVPAVIIGARLWYVVFQWSDYQSHPQDIFAVWQGGLAIQGGLVAGFITAFIFCRVRKISIPAFADAAIVGVPLAQAIGRWGNFINQEAYGTETTLPWAITVFDPVKGLIKVHPTFLYESLWDLAVFGFLLLFEKKWKHSNGELFCLYLIAYSFGRFFVEGLRTDSLMFMGLRTAQLTAIIMALCGLFGFIWLRRRPRQN